MSPDVTLAAGIVAAALLFVAVPALMGKAIHQADRQQQPRPAFDPFADIDFPDDGADTARRPDIEAAMRQALRLAATGSDRPDPAFVAHTRLRLVREADGGAR